MSKLCICKEYEGMFTEGFKYVESLEEHDKQIRADAIEDYTEWLRKTHANFDEEYAEDIKSDYLEQLNEQEIN